jgi:eight-cysteine-cluster-containing protein
VRKLAVPEDHPLGGRFEGGGFDDACTADADCHVGGCSQEVCSAEEGVVSTCEVMAVSLPEGTQCGCVEGACKWWNESGATLPPAPNPATAPCGGKPCTPPAECIEYFGVAGAAGPKLSECAIRCKPGDPQCPDGMRCVTIADGPGSVCRPEGDH